MLRNELSILTALGLIILLDSQNSPMIEYRIYSGKKKQHILREINNKRLSLSSSKKIILSKSIVESNQMPFDSLYVTWIVNHFRPDWKVRVPLFF